MLEIVIRNMHSSNVSAESMMSQFDSDVDGQLDAPEFFQGLCSLGLTLTQAQSQQLFEVVDTDHSGAIDIAEFAQLIVNPNKNPRLSTRVRHAPGGASSVPMGSYAPPEAESASTGRASVSGPRQPPDLTAQQIPLSANEQIPQRTSIKFEKHPPQLPHQPRRGVRSDLVALARVGLFRAALALALRKRAAEWRPRPQPARRTFGHRFRRRSRRSGTPRPAEQQEQE